MRNGMEERKEENRKLKNIKKNVKPAKIVKNLKNRLRLKYLKIIII